MPAVASLALAFSLCVFSDTACEDFSWSEHIVDAARWTRQPGWLSNASPTASVECKDKGGCFAVNEPGKGMKWSMPISSAVSLAERPYLLVRYSAENLNTKSTDYLIHLDDRVPGRQLKAIRLSDVIADGRWHWAAVDLSTLTSAVTVDLAAVQVQATSQGKARLQLGWLGFCETPPADATVIERTSQVAPKPDWTVPLAELAWRPERSWLANPAEEGKHSVQRSAETTVFRVAEPGRGMKWSCSLGKPMALEGHRYATLRYRAQGVGPHSDYALSGLGKLRKGGSGYRAIISANDLIADGRWHQLDVDLRHVAMELTETASLAMQVQAAGPDAVFEVSDLRLVNSRATNRLADAFPWQPGARFDGCKAVPIGSLAQGRTPLWTKHLRVDWFNASQVTVQGIPFALLPQEPALAETRVGTKSELRIPVDASASEVYLLLLAALTGSEESAYGHGELRAIADVDRFRLRLEYADGTRDECLPLNAVTKQFNVVAGPQVLVAAADPEKRLAAVVVCDRTRQAAFAVAAMTVRTDAQRQFPETQEPMPALRLASVAKADKTLDYVVSSNGPPVLERLTHRPTGWNYLTAPRPLVELRVGGKAIPAEELELVANAADSSSGTRWYKVRSVEGLRLGLDVKSSDGDSLAITARLENHGTREQTVTLVAPAVSYRLAEQPEEAYYLVPKRGAAMDNRPCSFEERYCGLFPVQFVDTFAPACARGLVLRTEDTTCLRKAYRLKKEGSVFQLGVTYPEQPLKPGGRFVTAPAILTATNGDWHRGLNDYRRWLTSWYKPLSPRKPWFREVFNFRQRFLWGLDPLYNSQEGKLDLLRAVEEARREFGGIDYLHLFDWGNCGRFGRIYGRIGDYSPYDYYQGGREALRRAIAGVQAEGVPVGLYIEGYLLEERGKLGQTHGKAWQMIGPDGRGRYWPECSEMYVCAHVPAWREVQAATYAEKVRELDVNGMYIDEYGFTGPQVDCWSKEHGHPVPSYSVEGERDGTQMVRSRIEGVKPGVALYTEESPPDVTSQYQDGSFTYAMSTSLRTQTQAPLNLFRFAVPDFKTIEILYCDKPTGSWATGVKWVFFNGEAIWLEGPAAEWFEPETREAIRQCHAILRQHRDAFTSREPVPLVPTELGGVFANAYPAKGKTVYTLYNARHSTVRGDVLRLAHRDGATYYDAWRQRPADVRIDGSTAIVRLELGPCDAGCLVVEDNQPKSPQGQ